MQTKKHNQKERKNNQKEKTQARKQSILSTQVNQQLKKKKKKTSFGATPASASALFITST
jgi:hypothetical protein